MIVRSSSEHLSGETQLEMSLSTAAADFRFFFQTSSAFGDLLDLSDHPLLLDIFSLGPPSSVLGWVFYFFFKVSFEKHPSVGVCSFSFSEISYS